MNANELKDLARKEISSLRGEKRNAMILKMIDLAGMHLTSQQADRFSFWAWGFEAR